MIPKEIEMDYVRVIDKAELPPNKMIIVVVGGKEVLLANVDDSYYAIINKCTHAGGSLAQGVLEGSIVTCPRHGDLYRSSRASATRVSNATCHGAGSYTCRE